MRILQIVYIQQFSYINYFIISESNYIFDHFTNISQKEVHKRTGCKIDSITEILKSWYMCENKKYRGRKRIVKNGTAMQVDKGQGLLFIGDTCVWIVK